MSINKRVHLIINDVFSGNKSAFAKRINVRPTTVANFTREEKPSSPSSDILEKIIINIPELNAEWLLTGQGDMLKENQIGYTDSQVISRNNNIRGNYNNISSLIGNGNSNVNIGNGSIKAKVSKLEDTTVLERRIVELEARIKEKDEFIRMLLESRNK